MGENIASGLKQFLQEWNLDEEKQMCLTTDSGANIVKSVTLNMWTRLSCFDHCLHIAIGKFTLSLLVSVYLNACTLSKHELNIYFICYACFCISNVTICSILNSNSLY